MSLVPKVCLEPVLHAHVAVSDFGLSKKLIIEELEYDVVELQEAIFNPTWLAPEVVQGKASGTAMDVYSFGSM